MLNGQNYTKNFYNTDKCNFVGNFIESERVCSKIGGGFSTLLDPVNQAIIEPINSDQLTISGNFTQHVINSISCTNIESPELNVDPVLRGIEDFINIDENEDLQYFFVSDHLGSSSFITDAGGEAVQHLQYLPFGESFVSQTSNSWQTRYTFSGKEKDEETGYSYFGARYYDSDLSVWLSVDPMSDRHPNFTPYAYVYQNPINLVDPWGEDSIQLNRDGTTKVFATTDDKFDVYVATNKEGNLDRSKTHTLYDKDVRNNRTDTQSYKEKNEETGKIETKTASIDFYEIDDYDKAKGFFEFAAQNTDVEWSHNIVGSSKRSIVTTSHMERAEASGIYFVDHKYYIVDRRHSHPNYPSPSDRDRNNVPAFQNRAPYSIKFYIYHKGNYFEYSNDWADGKPTKPKFY